MKNNMKSKIFRSTNCLVLAVLIISDILFTWLMYQQFLNRMEWEVRNGMTYIKAAVEEEGLDYLKGLPRGGENHRITLIAKDGAVLYDSVEDAGQLENHGDREEFIQAVREEYGESFRYSGSLGEQTYYYAVRLQDGSVLRLSSTVSSVFIALRNGLPLLILFVLMTIGISFIAANQQAKRLTAPINVLDLERPLENEVYEELSPLLLRLENQNRQIQEQIEKERRQQKDFETVTQNMQEGLILLNNGEEILLINEAARNIFDCDGEADIGRHYLTISRRKELTEAVKSALSGNTSESLITLQEKCYQILANPVTDSGRISGAILLVKDVTAAIHAEQQRREFVANVSHELKTPLMSISGYAEIIQDGIAKEEDIPRFSQRIFQEARRLTTLVEDIIKLSELDDAQLTHISEVVDLKELAEQVVTYLQPEAAQKQIEMSVTGQSVSINGVRNILEEMIYNLCDNAIKYNVDGGSVRVEISGGKSSRKILVADTGIGIPKDDQDRVFERFYRVDKSHSRKSGGTGLGLSIVKHGALLHHAVIRLESTPGKGTEISVTFPDS